MPITSRISAPPTNNNLGMCGVEERNIKMSYCLYRLGLSIKTSVGSVGVQRIHTDTAPDVDNRSGCFHLFFPWPTLLPLFLRTTWEIILHGINKMKNSDDCLWRQALYRCGFPVPRTAPFPIEVMIGKSQTWYSMLL